MFNLKSMAVAAVVTLGSVSAFAVTVPVGSIASGTTKATPESSVFAAGASFSDTLTFSITGNNLVTIVVSSPSTPGTILNGPGGPKVKGATGLQTFNAVLDGTKSLTLSTSAGTKTLTLNDTLLATGSHSLVISGKAIAGGPGAYSAGSITVVTTPVPEPETYALMLAGLGALGFVARRRKSA